MVVKSELKFNILINISIHSIYINRSECHVKNIIANFKFNREKRTNFHTVNTFY